MGPIFGILGLITVPILGGWVGLRRQAMHDCNGRLPSCAATDVSDSSEVGYGYNCSKTVFGPQISTIEIDDY